MEDPPVVLDASISRREETESRVGAHGELMRVRARDSRALGAFFDAHFPAIYGFLYRVLGNRELAEDLVQETFFRAHRAIDRIDPNRNPRHWLLTIALNACRDHWKSAAHQAVSRSTSLDDSAQGVGDATPDARPNPEDALLGREREQLVQAALLRLDSDARTVLVMREYEDMEYEEIAASLGVSVAAARKRYSRALVDLARELKGRIS